MARPRRISDDQILDATRAAVKQLGPRVSLDVIANALAVSQPALLKRFGSRNRLMVAALKPPAEVPFAARLRAGPDDRPLRDQLHEVIGWLAAYYEQSAPLMAALRESGIPMCDVFPRADGEPTPLRIKRGIAEWLERAKRRGLVVGDFDTETVAFSLVATVSARSHLRHLFQGCRVATSGRAFLKSVTDFFVRALAPTHPLPRRPRRSA